MSAGRKPAFPTTGPFEPNLKNSSFAYPGISIRDYFAAMALAGLCASEATEHDAFQIIAAQSYMAADAMLAARKRQPAADRDELLAVLMDARKELWNVHHSHMSEAEFHSRFANIDAAIRKAEGRQP